MTENLIERYLQQVERQLPRPKRADITAELRSALKDGLEARHGPNAGEQEVVALLKEFGPPQEVAALYRPEGQYLIGPALFPLFKLVLWITLAAAIGGQLLAHAVSILLAQGAIDPVSALTGLIDSVPVAVGMVVVVFALLQRFGVKPEDGRQDWDPRTLPELATGAEVNRLEKTIEIGFGIVFLVVVASFAQSGLFATGPTPTFFSNPIINGNLGWIFASLLLSLGVDLYLLWYGRWATPTHLAKLGSILFSIGVVGLLFQGHSAWLAQHGVGGLIAAIERMPQASGASLQVLGMEVFRIALGVALLVTVVEAAVTGVRFARQWLRGDPSTERLHASQL